MSQNSPTQSSITQTLTDLGLGQNEAALYEILLANPDASIPLLKQKSPFSRTMLYYILEQLEAYDLLEKKELGKKTVFNAAPPEKLEEMFAERQKELDRQKGMLGKVIGDLRSAYNLAHNRPGVKFFEGLAGIKEVTMDSLKSAGTIYTFADTEAVEKFVKDINEDYKKKRMAKKIPKKIIALDTEFAREHYKNSANDFTEVRLIKACLSPFKTGMQIYNNSISYSTLSTDKKIGVIIVDANIASMHRSLFEYIWNSLPAFNAPAKTS